MNQEIKKPPQNPWPQHPKSNAIHGSIWREADTAWREWIAKAPIRNYLPPQSITPLNMNTYAESIREMLLEGEK